MSLTSSGPKNFILVVLSSLFAVTLFLAFDFVIALVVCSATRELTPDEKPYLAKDNGWYELKRNFSGHNQFGERIYTVHTDNYGFRKKPNSESVSQHDLIFLGDSFTFGVHGPWEETFVGMFSDDSGRDALNAGVGSYSPTPYLHQYKRALAASLLSDGHTVVIGIDLSDVQDEAGYWIDGETHPRKRDEELAFKKTRRQLVKSNPIKMFMRDSFPYTTLLYRYIRYNLTATAEKNTNPKALTDLPRSAITYAEWTDLDKTVPYATPSGYAPLGVKGGLEKLERKLSEIVQISRQHDAKDYFLIYPWPAQIAHTDKFSWSDFVAGMCTRMSCDGVIDTIPHFRRLAQQDESWLETYFYSWDIHFSKQGNRVVADALLKHIPEK